MDWPPRCLEYLFAKELQLEMNTNIDHDSMDIYSFNSISFLFLKYSESNKSAWETKASKMGMAKINTVLTHSLHIVFLIQKLGFLSSVF